MFSRGEPSPLAQRVIETFIESLSIAQAALSPGVPLSEVAEAIAGVLAPIAPRSYTPYGHGIGMDNFEPPPLSVDSDEVAEINMIVVTHPVLIVESRRFSLGDTYLVTETGAERLSQYPLELVVV